MRCGFPSARQNRHEKSQVLRELLRIIPLWIDGYKDRCNSLTMARFVQCVHHGSEFTHLGGTNVRAAREAEKHQQVSPREIVLTGSLSRMVDQGKRDAIVAIFVVQHRKCKRREHDA